jgi:hypothetical protein
MLIVKGGLPAETFQNTWDEQKGRSVEAAAWCDPRRKFSGGGPSSWLLFS